MFKHDHVWKLKDTCTFYIVSVTSFGTFLTITLNAILPAETLGLMVLQTVKLTIILVALHQSSNDNTSSKPNAKCTYFDFQQVVKLQKEGKVMRDNVQKILRKYLDVMDVWQQLPTHVQRVSWECSVGHVVTCRSFC